MRVFFNNLKRNFSAIIFLIVFCSSLIQTQTFSSSGIIYLSSTNLLNSSSVNLQIIRAQIEAGTPVIYEGSGNELITTLGLKTCIVPENDIPYYFALLKLPNGIFNQASFFLAKQYKKEYSVYKNSNVKFNETDSVQIIYTEEEILKAKNQILNAANSWVLEKLSNNMLKNPEGIADIGAWNSIETYDWVQNCVGTDNLTDATITMTVTAYKIQDNKADKDYYLTETRLHHQNNVHANYVNTYPGLFQTGWVGWYVDYRHMTNWSGASSNELISYGPTTSIGSSTTSISIGGEISPSPGISASYTTSYSTADVNITDQSSLTWPYGMWWEDFKGPGGNYPTNSWPCNNAKYSFYSLQAVIWSTPNIMQGVPVSLRAGYKIYKDKIVDHGVYITITNYYYEPELGPKYFTAFKNYNPIVENPPSGPVEFWINSPQQFQTSGFDQDGNPLSFMFEWESSIYSAWDSSTQTHTWTEGGNKGVRVKAKDVPYEAQSEWSPTLNIHVKSISRIEISGPDQINSNSYGQYNCTAFFTNNNTIGVSPIWSIESGSEYASIDSSGRLTPNNITQTQTITILATYTDHGKTVTATKSVQINFVTSVEELSSDIPSDYKLFQNYPNPFNPSTILRFALPQRSRVYLSIFDALGKEVSRPLNGVEMNAGTFELPWAGKDVTGNTLASGLYIMKIIATRDNPEIPDYVNTKKLLLLK